jgi:hypothetical protein
MVDRRDAKEIKNRAKIFISEKRFAGSDWFCRIITRYQTSAHCKTAAIGGKKSLAEKKGIVW